MSAPDRSWTIAPTLLWFVALLIPVLWIDGGVGVLADRVRAPREARELASAGPAFATGPAVVPEAPASAASRRSDGRSDDEERSPQPAAVVPASRSKILALEDVCVDGAPEDCKRWAMDGFYRAIDRSKHGALGRPVRVSWYGDSVIATDVIPSRLRTRLQDELGNGGPGFLYVVPPHRFCGHEAITRWSSSGWVAHAISTTLIPDGLYGVGGSTAETDDGKATIKLVSGTASRAELYYLAQPRGGSVAIAADGKPVAIVETRSASKQPGHAVASVADGAAKFELLVTGKVRVFGLDLENATGAVVDNLGVVSVNLKSFEANRPEHFEAELAHRGSDLVMIMIGANEAAWLLPSDRATKDYAARYGKLLAEFRTALPDASCLVVSPTDQAEAKDGGYVSRAVMPVLVKAQRDAARAAGCAFYSTYDWMGGSGSAARWFRKGLVGTDFQHLSHKGADRLADGLFGALMLAFQKYASH